MRTKPKSPRGTCRFWPLRRQSKGLAESAKYAQALHAALFLSRDPVADMEFDSLDDASAWVQESVQKMMRLAEHMVPSRIIFPKRGPPRQYSPFGTGHAHRWLKIAQQFAAGMYGSKYSTDKMENMQSIPRRCCKHDARSTQYGKTPSGDHAKSKPSCCDCSQSAQSC